MSKPESKIGDNVRKCRKKPAIMLNSLSVLRDLSFHIVVNVKAGSGPISKIETVKYYRAH